MVGLLCEADCEHESCYCVSCMYRDSGVFLNTVTSCLTRHFPVGPGVLACATHGGGRSEAGHCFHLLFSSFFFFFLLFLLFLFLRLLLFTHFGESPVRENLFPPIFWHN